MPGPMPAPHPHIQRAAGRPCAARAAREEPQGPPDTHWHPRQSQAPGPAPQRAESTVLPDPAGRPDDPPWPIKQRRMCVQSARARLCAATPGNNEVGVRCGRLSGTSCAGIRAVEPAAAAGGPSTAPAQHPPFDPPDQSPPAADRYSAVGASRRGRACPGPLAGPMAASQLEWQDSNLSGPMSKDILLISWLRTLTRSTADIGGLLDALFSSIKVVEPSRCCAGVL